MANINRGTWMTAGGCPPAMLCLSSDATARGKHVQDIAARPSQSPASHSELTIIAVIQMAMKRQLKQTVVCITYMQKNSVLAIIYDGKDGNARAAKASSYAAAAMTLLISSLLLLVLRAACNACIPCHDHDAPRTVRCCSRCGATSITRVFRNPQHIIVGILPGYHLWQQSALPQCTEIKHKTTVILRSMIICSCRVRRNPEFCFELIRLKH